MKRTRIVYSKDFKDKAVELSIQRGNIAEVARELGVSLLDFYSKTLKTLTYTK